MKSDISQKIILHGGIEAYLCAQQHKGLLRFLTCGSVDDGKSTLIGRLLHDTQQICEDQLYMLRNDNKRINKQYNKLNLALLVDGLQAEREQGITIDVAYRYFSTDKRKFIIADTPGHEQYTRNMATGASNCDLAVLLIDARKGVLDQTRRHSFVSTLLGIQHLIVAVNKMDLVEFNQKVFENIRQDYLCFSKKLPVNLNIKFIPISAINGDNIANPSTNMSWYAGPTLLDILETAKILDVKKQKPMRFPIQYVNRANSDFRGYAGTLATGELNIGQKIQVLPSKIKSTIKRILTFDGDISKAYAGEAITLVLEDEIDISRGDLLIDSEEQLSTVKKAQIEVVWMTERPLTAGQSFDIKIAGKKTQAKVNNIEYQIDTNTLNKHVAKELPLNGIGTIELEFYEPIILERYVDNKITGSMIFIDKLSNITVGAGLVRQPIYNVHQSESNNYNKFEVELNQLIRRHFPDWGVVDLLTEANNGN